MTRIRRTVTQAHPRTRAPHPRTRALAHLRTIPCFLVLLLTTTSAQAPTDPRSILDRAIADFEGGRIAESVAGFDRLVEIAPQVEPQLWQRGIALYYAGRYRECRFQFEAHRTVNPDDVENAAWHFLCVAREESPERARTALLPVGPDARVPMREIYEMFRGSLSPVQVLALGSTQPSAQFYGHLYVGLYYEALGDARRAREELTRAASDRYKSAGGYMHMVARVHVQRLSR